MSRSLFRLLSLSPTSLLVLLLHASPTVAATGGLFAADAPVRQWAEFQAEGYKRPVAGIVFTNDNGVCAGMPLGGVGTGCLDIETSGVWGFSSLFFPSQMVEPTPYQTLRKAQLMSPFMGISVGGKTWVLASKEMVEGGEFQGCVDPVDPGSYVKNETYMKHWRVVVPPIENVQPVNSLRYWGHYPIVDVDYATDAPVAVSLRAWSTFLPGDAQASAAPAAVFEARLKNETSERQTGTLAFNFPGPHADEAGAGPTTRAEAARPGWKAVVVGRSRAKYAIAALDSERVRWGGDLSSGSPSSGNDAWSRIGDRLPTPADDDLGASAAVDFTLEPQETAVIRFVLAWHVADWQAGAYNEIKHFDETWTTNDFTLSKTDRTSRARYRPDYCRRYAGPLDVVEEIAATHASRLARIVAWQEVVYADERLPAWLRAALIDNLHLFAEDSVWAAPEGETSAWARPLGAFQLVECPRTCAVMGCIASNYYGDLPVAYFFPQLERQILRGYVAGMRPDGAVPFLYPPNDFTKAAYEWQIGLNGACFADLVHRLWMRTRDKSILEEFYPAVKKNLVFTVHLASGEHGLVSFHREGSGQEWWEHTPVYGMVTHLAGVRIAQIRFAGDMAMQMGDDSFARQCDAWVDQASALVEEHLWNDETQSYDFYRYPAKNMRSTDIMSSQLDGQWMTDLHGLPPAFRKERIRAALDTIRDACLVDMGLAGFAEPGKGPDLARYGTFPPEVHIVAMTYMFHGQRDLGLEIARRNMDNIIRVQGLGWDMPNLIRCDTGARTYGADYYQNMVLWGLPASLEGKDLASPCAPGGLVAKILDAARE